MNEAARQGHAQKKAYLGRIERADSRLWHAQNVNAAAPGVKGAKRTKSTEPPLPLFRADHCAALSGRDPWTVRFGLTALRSRAKVALPCNVRLASTSSPRCKWGTSPSTCARAVAGGFGSTLSSCNGSTIRKRSEEHTSE